MSPRIKSQEPTPIDLSSESITIRPSFQLSDLIGAYAAEIEQMECRKVSKAEAVRRALAVFLTRHWSPAEAPGDKHKKR